MIHLKKFAIAAGIALATSTAAIAQTTVIQTTPEARDPAAEGGALGGAAAGAVGGAIVGGPVGAAVGGIAGAATGAIAGDIANPSPEVREYVVSNRVEPVQVETEVVVGSTLPETVVLQPIPDYEYQYVYVNERPVLVEPSTRRVVYVVE